MQRKLCIDLTVVCCRSVSNNNDYTIVFITHIIVIIININDVSGI